MSEEKKSETQDDTKETKEEKVSEKEPVSEFVIENGILKKYVKHEENEEKKNPFSRIVSFLFPPKAESHVIVPKEVRSVGPGAFKNCKDILSVTFTSDITEIGHYAFFGCKNLTSIVAPHTVTLIGDYAFKGCRRLPTIEITYNVKKIGRGAFDNTIVTII